MVTNSDGFTPEEQAGIDMLNHLSSVYITWLKYNGIPCTFSADELLFDAKHGDNVHGLKDWGIEYLESYCLLWELTERA